MSFLDDALANTVGVVWRAGSGTVDPWTKQQIVDEAAAAQVTASGGMITPAQAQAQAQQDVTTTLTTFGDGSGADPSQVLNGVKTSLNLLGQYGTNLGKTVLYIGIGVALIYAISELRLLRSATK
jgi:hypothetical protein